MLLCSVMFLCTQEYKQPVCNKYTINGMDWKQQIHKQLFNSELSGDRLLINQIIVDFVHQQMPDNHI